MLFEPIHARIRKPNILRRALQNPQRPAVIPRRLRNPIRNARQPQDEVSNRIHVQQHHPPHILIDVIRLPDPDPRRRNQLLLALLLLLRLPRKRLGRGQRKVVVGLARAGPGPPVDGPVVGEPEVHLEAVRVVAVVERVRAAAGVAHAQALVHVREDVDVDAEGDDDDGEAPPVAQRVPQPLAVVADPAPVARHGLDGVDAEGRAACAPVSIRKF